MEPAENTTKNQVLNPSAAVEIFGPNFLDETVCRQWILNKLHPAGARCPGCGIRLPGKKAATFWHDRPVRCCHCNKSFSARTGTVLAGKAMTYSDIVFMLYLMARGDSDIQIAGALEVNRETVRLWRREYQE